MTFCLFQSPKAELAQLGQVFDKIVEIFLFFDQNGDGKLNKKDMVKTMNETNPRERSPAHITKNRFSIVHFNSSLLTCSINCWSPKIYHFLVLVLVISTLVLLVQNKKD
jgi:hypothetical protein